jgi:hypothetical protein
LPSVTTRFSDLRPGRRKKLQLETETRLENRLELLPQFRARWNAHDGLSFFLRRRKRLLPFVLLCRLRTRPIEGYGAEESDDDE